MIMRVSHRDAHFYLICGRTMNILEFGIWIIGKEGLQFFSYKDYK